MKIIHTSDWHLGIKLKNRERINEQKDILNNFCDYVDSVNADLVLIAGDVYHTYSPSADAEELFFDTVKKLSNGKRAVIVISGNHDDSDRLFASRSLTESFGVYFAGSKEYSFKRLENVTLISSCKNTFTIEDKSGERVFINALSFPTEARLKEKVNDNECYNDKIKRWISEGSSLNAQNLPEILLTHLFMLGGEAGSTEKPIDLGGARLVNPNVINENCIYTALGHLHKPQTVSNTKNIYYSGSLLEYAFDETGNEKSFIEFDVFKGQVNNLKKIPYIGGNKLKSIEIIGYANCFEVLETFKDYYIELILHTDKPLSTEETNAISKYSNVVNFEIVTKEDEFESNVVDRRKLNDKELFILHYKNMYGSEPENDLLELYLKLISTEEL